MHLKLPGKGWHRPELRERSKPGFQLGGIQAEQEKRWLRLNGRGESGVSVNWGHLGQN